MVVKLFNQNIRMPLLLLASAECFVLWLAVVLAHTAPFKWLGTEVTDDQLPWRALTSATVMLIALLAVGLYQFNQRLNRKEVLARVIVAFVGGWLVLAAVYFIVPVIGLSRPAGLASAVLGFLGVLAVREIFYKTVDQNVFRRRCLVFGAGANAANIAMLRRASDRRGFRVLGYVHPKDTPVRVLEMKPEPLVIDYDRPLIEIATRLRADELVVALEDRRGKLPVKELVDLRLAGISIIDLTGFMERETAKLRIDFLQPSWIIFSDGFALNSFRAITKRLLDLLIAIPAVLIALPFMVATAACILFERTGSSIFYRQIRVGERGKTFAVLKFRSMREDAEADGKPKWATQDDNRVTRVGRFIRKARIDEVPQLLNVLRGDMSIVGPRPERPTFVAELIQQIPYYAERHCVKPGITGWAQLKYPYGASVADAIQKLQYDLYYVKNQSLLLDLAIMLQTVEVLLFGKGAR